MNMAYWQDRMTAAQQELLNKSRREIERKMKKYYIKLSKQLISEYEALYDKVLLKKAAGEQISPATLYQMDKYWDLQAQTRKRLMKYGAYQQSLLSKVFEIFYKGSYNAISIQGLTAYKTLDDKAIQQVLEQIWTADGKSWSTRIWNNTALLQETLETGLVECVAAGRTTAQLKQTLQDRFSVDYNRADTLVRTELAHIQTEAARQRYKDYGLEQVEIWADPDERTCEVCGKLHKKKYPVNAKVPIPAHPRCRCCIVPVVDIKTKPVIEGLDNN
jgi:SPP1 gp7 family putative phage head morphogenesis protein